METKEVTRDLFEPYKALAAAVMQCAIADLRTKHRSEEALRFLTSPQRLADRDLWLSWLNLEDAAFQELLRKSKFQGQPNRLQIGA